MSSIPTPRSAPFLFEFPGSFAKRLMASSNFDWASGDGIRSATCDAAEIS